jgi:hypothetical protein
MAYPQLIGEKSEELIGFIVKALRKRSGGSLCLIVRDYSLQEFIEMAETLGRIDHRLGRRHSFMRQPVARNGQLRILDKFLSEFGAKRVQIPRAGIGG